MGAGKAISEPWAALMAWNRSPWEEAYKDLQVVQNTQESRKGRNIKSETAAEGISPMASLSEM